MINELDEFSESFRIDEYDELNNLHSKLLEINYQTLIYFREFLFVAYEFCARIYDTCMRRKKKQHTTKYA